MRPEWKDFVGGKWDKEVNVRDFIQRNYHPYDGDESFLAGPTQDTKDLWAQVLDLQKQEREAGGGRGERRTAGRAPREHGELHQAPREARGDSELL